MKAAPSSPARPRFDRFRLDRLRFDRYRFDKGRATLALLLLSAALLGLSALQQAGLLPAQEGQARPSIWDGGPRPDAARPGAAR